MHFNKCCSSLKGCTQYTVLFTLTQILYIVICDYCCYCLLVVPELPHFWLKHCFVLFRQRSKAKRRVNCCSHLRVAFKECLGQISSSILTSIIHLCCLEHLVAQTMPIGLAWVKRKGVTMLSAVVPESVSNGHCRNCLNAGMSKWQFMG